MIKPMGLSIIVPNRLLNFCRDRISQNTTFSIPPISVFEVGISILKLDNKKSTGWDGISVKLLKIALPYIAETLTYIYNLCIQKNVFPTAFKRAKVISLPKTKNYLHRSERLPPYLDLSVLTKPLERHIHKHLTNFLETHQLFHSFQSGFRCGHSFQTAVYPFNWYLALSFQQPSNVRRCISRFSQGFWPGSSRYFTEKTIHVQLKHRKYSFLKILFTGSYTMRACKWHILPRNVYNKWSASRVDPRPTSVLHLY